MTLPMTPLTTSINTLQFGALGPNAQIDVNGDVGSMSVQNVNLGPSGHVVIAGNLNSLTVTGIFQGQGTSAIDLSVGLNLTNFTVLGGSSNLGGVRSANIDVAKSILGLDVPHGIFNSFITADLLIDGSPQNNSAGGNLGADGPD